MSKELICNEHLPNNAYDAPSYIWLSFYVKQFMESLFLLLFPQLANDEVEDAVEKDHNQD